MIGSEAPDAWRHPPAFAAAFVLEAGVIGLSFRRVLLVVEVTSDASAVIHATPRKHRIAQYALGTNRALADTARTARDA